MGMQKEVYLSRIILGEMGCHMSATTWFGIVGLPTVALSLALLVM